MSLIWLRISFSPFHVSRKVGSDSVGKAAASRPADERNQQSFDRSLLIEVSGASCSVL